MNSLKRIEDLIKTAYSYLYTGEKAINSSLLSFNSFAVLLTCFNRKEKTLLCLSSIYRSKERCSFKFLMDIYLTDDGSMDGTESLVKQTFPEVYVIKGTGSLYWAGGMRKSWNEALKKQYDFYLLLNDDTTITENCFEEIIVTHKYSVKSFKTPGIYIGSVRSPNTNYFTYGGRILVNKWTYETKKIIPDGTIHSCQFGNANIMCVHQKVVEKIGILSNKYIHKVADFDYTLKATKIGIPVLVCSDYCGYCEINQDLPDNIKMNLKDRIKHLKDPKGIAIKDYLFYMWRFFPWRVPFVFISLWLKTLFPSIKFVIDRLLNRTSS